MTQFVYRSVSKLVSRTLLQSCERVISGIQISAEPPGFTSSPELDLVMLGRQAWCLIVSPIDVETFFISHFNSFKQVEFRRACLHLGHGWPLTAAAGFSACFDPYWETGLRNQAKVDLTVFLPHRFPLITAIKHHFNFRIFTSHLPLHSSTLFFSHSRRQDYLRWAVNHFLIPHIWFILYVYANKGHPQE